MELFFFRLLQIFLVVVVTLLSVGILTPQITQRFRHYQWESGNPTENDEQADMDGANGHHYGSAPWDHLSIEAGPHDQQSNSFVLPSNSHLLELERSRQRNDLLWQKNEQLKKENRELKKMLTNQSNGQDGKEKNHKEMEEKILPFKGVDASGEKSLTTKKQVEGDIVDASYVPTGLAERDQDTGNDNLQVPMHAGDQHYTTDLTPNSGEGKEDIDATNMLDVDLNERVEKVDQEPPD